MTDDKFDIERRLKLRAALDALAALDAACPVEGFMAESLAVENAVEALKDGFGKDVAPTCEGCSKIILFSDQGHRCLEGEYLCEECTPTWEDVKAQWDDGSLQGDTGEEDSDKASFTRRYEKHLADGGKPGDLMLYTL